MREDIEAIIFDLDNTLYDFSGAWLKANKKMYNYLNLSNYIAYTEFFDIFKKHNSNILKDVSEGKARLRQLRFLRIIATMKDLNIYYTEEDARKYYDKMFDFILENIEENKNLIDNLLYLKKKYKLYILTNGIAREQKLKLEKLGVAEIFDKIYISSETMINKPNEKAFLQITEENKLKLKSTLMVGDSYYHDIKPAIKLGLQTCFIERQWHLNDTKESYSYSGHKIENLDELFFYLKDIRTDTCNS